MRRVMVARLRAGTRSEPCTAKKAEPTTAAAPRASHPRRARPAEGTLCAPEFALANTLPLLHRDAVGARRSGREGRVEVEFETRILGKGVMGNVDDPDSMVAFEVNDACVVLIQKVI